MTGSGAMTAGAQPDSARSLRVMQSFGRPRATSNPYIHMLDEALRSTPGIEHLNFNRGRALLGRYDVIHFHWPEVALGGSTPLRRFARRSYFQVLMWKLRLSKTAIVRTVHNVELPSGLSARERRLLEQLEARTKLRILINPVTTLPRGQAHTTILHGHYIEWFRGMPAAEPTTGLLGFVGLIRKYKGVEGLVRAFKAISPGEQQLALLIAGQPSSAELASEISDLARDDGRIRLELGYLSEQDYALAVTRSEIVVLPYRFMHNSGSVLAALSLERPVLVPRTEVNSALGREVGPGWIYSYDGELDSNDLREAVALVRADPRSPAPDLSLRDWQGAGPAHLDAFRQAASRAAHRRRF